MYSENSIICRRYAITIITIIGLHGRCESETRIVAAKIKCTRKVEGIVGEITKQTLKYQIN